jgi:lipopolysaccharide transport system permease protein
MRNILTQHRHLIKSLIIRDISARYKGSIIGILWSFITPLMMLIIYTFVFSVVFKAKWNVDTESQTSFSIVLFVGLIIHNFFSEVVNKSPAVITSNPNYVKKVIFPLEILPLVATISAVINMIISILILVVAIIVLQNGISAKILYLPVILFPLIILTLGVSWFLASIGAYLRDINYITTIVTTVMLFLTPVFYPLSAMPEKYHPYILSNPLTFIIEQSRNVAIFNKDPDFLGIVIYTVLASIFTMFGYLWFEKTKKGFADVI